MKNNKNRPSRKLIIITSVIVSFALLLLILQIIVDSRIK